MIKDDILLQGDSVRVRYNKNDNRFLFLPKNFYLEDGTKIQIPWFWVGFKESWCFHRTFEAKKQLNENGIEAVIRVDRMRFKVVNFVLEQVNIIRKIEYDGK